MLKPLFKGTVVLSLMTLVVQIGNIALLPLYSNLIEPEMFGVLGLLAPFTSLVSTLMCLGFPTAQSRELIDLHENSTNFGSYLFTITTFLLLVSSAGLSLLVLPFTRELFLSLFGLNNIQHHYVLMAYVSGILSNFVLMINIYYNFQQIYTKRALATLVGFFVSNILTILIIISFSDGASGKLLGGISLQFFLLIVLGSKYFKIFQFQFNRQYIRSSLYIGVPVTITGIFVVFTNSGNRFIMNKFLPLDLIGQYTMAWTITSPIAIIFRAFHVVWIPLFFQRMKRNGVNTEMETFIGILAILITFCIVVLQVFIGDIARVLLSSEYYPAVQLSVLLLPFFLVDPISTLVSDYLLYFKATHWATITYTVVGILSLGANYIAIPLGGIEASIGLMIASQIVIGIIFFIILHSVYNITFNYGRFIILFCIVLNPLNITMGKLQIDDGQTVLSKLLYCLLTLAILFFLIPQRKTCLSKIRNIVLIEYKKRMAIF